MGRNIKHTFVVNTKQILMNEIIMNVYEAVPVLREMLNISGFCTKVLKSSRYWLDGKYERKEFYNVKPGFGETDVAAVNDGLKAVSKFCVDRILKSPLECADIEIYGKYASRQLKELRAIISMPYLRTKHTSMAEETFGKKMRLAMNKNGKPSRFSDKDIEEINTGILAMAETFSRIELTL